MEVAAVGAYHMRLAVTLRLSQHTDMWVSQQCKVHNIT